MISWAHFNGREIVTYNIRCRSNAPVLIASLSETFDDIGFVTHEPQEAHDFLAACANSKARAR